jgi:hypothetical protein
LYIFIDGESLDFPTLMLRLRSGQRPHILVKDGAGFSRALIGFGAKEETYQSWTGRLLKHGVSEQD